MKLLIVVYHRFDLWNAPTWFAERLRKDFPRIEIVHLTSYEGVEEQLRDSEIVFTISLRPEQFAVAKKLRWIHAPAAAVHQLLIPEVVNSDVVVTNAREVHGPVVAEHVIALVFALAKKIPQAVRLQQRRVWGQELIWNDGPKPCELAGATLGLIGLGSIGREVAARASALGMQVIGVREHAEREKPPWIDEVFSSDRLDQMLAQSDYVVLAAPLTPATRGLMNAKRLRSMNLESRCPADHSPHCGTDGKTVAAALRSFLSEPAAICGAGAVAVRRGQGKRVLSTGLESVTLCRRWRERSAPALHATVFSAEFHGTSAYSHSTPGQAGCGGRGVERPGTVG